MGSGASVGFAGRLTGPPSTVAYITWIPPGAAGEVGGANAIMNFPALRAGPGVPAVLSSFASTGVVPLRMDVQVWPPSLDRNTPRPLMPAYRMRAPGGEVGSSCRERTSPVGVTPWVQLKPPSWETNSPELQAR